MIRWANPPFRVTPGPGLCNLVAFPGRCHSRQPVRPPRQARQLFSNFAEPGNVDWDKTWGSNPQVHEDSIEQYLAEGPTSTLRGQRFGFTWEEWQRTSLDIAALLGETPGNATQAALSRVFHFYLPAFLWAQQLVMLHGQKRAGRVLRERDGDPGALVLGMTAPQGSGKTTLVSLLKKLFQQREISCAVVSIDDFYLTGSEQDTLAAQHPQNPLLQKRGNAGTHDIALGHRTIQELKMAADGREVRVPSYDKSARDGRGDRVPPEAWPVETGPIDVVLVEGWMLGFEPLPPDSAELQAAGLQEVNSLLSHYKELNDLIQAWLVVQVDDPVHVYDWRAQAEREMRASGRGGMTEAQVQDFVSCYMPAYKAYLPALYKAGPAGPSEADLPTLNIRVDKARGPTDVWQGT